MSCNTDSDTEFFHFRDSNTVSGVLVCQQKFLQIERLYLQFIAAGHLAQAPRQQVMSSQGHSR